MIKNSLSPCEVKGKAKRLNFIRIS